MKRCVIVIPCYNESGRLDINAFDGFIQHNPNIKFVFVNDGSSDNTGSILRELCQKTSSLYVELTKNSGKAEAVRQGMLAGCGEDADWIGFWDADLATPLEEIFWLLSFAEKDTLALSGCRLLRLGGRIRRKTLRHLLGRVFATVTAWHLGIAVYDTQCGAKLFAAQEIQRLFQEKFVTRWFFDVEIFKRLIKIHGHDAIVSRCIEVPLHTWKDISESKLRYFACLIDFCKLLRS